MGGSWDISHRNWEPGKSTWLAKGKPEVVVGSGVTKHILEDTQDSGVQFIMPVGQRGISSQQGPWCFWKAQYYILHCVTAYMLATSLLCVTEFYYTKVLGEQTIMVKVVCGGNNDYTSRGDVSMVNLTGAAWPQLQSPFAICREGSLQETWFSLATVFSVLGRVQAQFTSCL